MNWWRRSQGHERPRLALITPRRGFLYALSAVFALFLAAEPVAACLDFPVDRRTITLHCSRGTLALSGTHQDSPLDEWNERSAQTVGCADDLRNFRREIAAGYETWAARRPTEGTGTNGSLFRLHKLPGVLVFAPWSPEREAEVRQTQIVSRDDCTPWTMAERRGDWLMSYAQYPPYCAESPTGLWAKVSSCTIEYPVTFSPLRYELYLVQNGNFTQALFILLFIGALFAAGLAVPVRRRELWACLRPRLWPTVAATMLTLPLLLVAVVSDPLVWWFVPLPYLTVSLLRYYLAHAIAWARGFRRSAA